jgi:hypothetical protein
MGTTVHPTSGSSSTLTVDTEAAGVAGLFVAILYHIVG